MVEPVAKPSVVLTTVLQTLYTVPASKLAQIPPLGLYNSHTTDVDVTIEYIPSGDGDGQLKNRIVVTVAAGMTDITPFTKHLAAAGAVKALASVTAVVSAFIEPIERDV